MKKEDKEFIRGYVCACANILSAYGFGEEVPVKEALKGISFSRVDLRIIDRYDKGILKQYGFIPRKSKERREGIWTL